MKSKVTITTWNNNDDNNNKNNNNDNEDDVDYYTDCNDNNTYSFNIQRHWHRTAK